MQHDERNHQEREFLVAQDRLNRQPLALSLSKKRQFSKRALAKFKLESWHFVKQHLIHVLEWQVAAHETCTNGTAIVEMRGFEGPLVEAQAGQLGIGDSVVLLQLPIDRVVIGF